MLSALYQVELRASALLCKGLRDSSQSRHACSTDCGAFIELMEKVLELNTIFRPTPQSQASCPPHVPSVFVSSVPVHPASSPLATDSSSFVSRKKWTCTNCKLRSFHGIGHTRATCLHCGGGMKGCREGYRD